MNIWTICKGKQFTKEIIVESWRVVEAQHILSARDLVDSQEEHDLLEDLIEDSKPHIDIEKNYLIFTPFRYPPLKYGSRFGGVFEPSLWYGSLELETAFTEVAYYRLQFFADTLAELGYIEISMTAFTAHIASSVGVDLTLQPFHQYSKLISNKSSYNDSQLLGKDMRNDKIEAFIYWSARTHDLSKNVATFKPSVFQLKKGQYIHHQQNWKCLSQKQSVEFTRIDMVGRKRFSFSKDHFHL